MNGTRSRGDAEKRIGAQRAPKKVFQLYTVSTAKKNSAPPRLRVNNFLQPTKGT